MSILIVEVTLYVYVLVYYTWYIVFLEVGVDSLEEVVDIRLSYV
jgi:hypothetical protein